MSRATLEYMLSTNVCIAHGLPDKFPKPHPKVRLIVSTEVQKSRNEVSGVGIYLWKGKGHEALENGT